MTPGGSIERVDGDGPEDHAFLRARAGACITMERMMSTTGALAEGGARDSRREARREALLDAAIEVIRQRGPDASMEEIARRAGITKPVVYRYFGDRAGLYRAVAERYCDRLKRDFLNAMSRRRDLRGIVTGAIDGYLAFIEAEPRVHQFLLHPQPDQRGGERVPVRAYSWHVGEEIAAALRMRLEAAALDTEIARPWGHAIAGMVQAAGTWWSHQDGPAIPRAKLVEYLVTLLWSGLGSATETLDLIQPPRSRHGTGDLSPRPSTSAAHDADA
jgi:AcrR family transcriptional regulator